MLYLLNSHESGDNLYFQKSAQHLMKEVGLSLSTLYVLNNVDRMFCILCRDSLGEGSLLGRCFLNTKVSARKKFDINGYTRIIDSLSWVLRDELLTRLHLHASGAHFEVSQSRRKSTIEGHLFS